MSVAGLQAYRPQVEAVLAFMAEQLAAIGMTAELPGWSDALTSLEQDPVDASPIFNGKWRDSHGYQQGEITIRADGMIWAECDILQPHPTRARWFVEAITTWGTTDSLAGEPRLIPMPD